MISNQLPQLIKEAMLGRDQVASSTYRMLKSELHNASIAKTGELTEDEELQIVRRELKKRTEAAAMYEKAGETTRAEAEQAEGKLLEVLLPAAPKLAVVAQYVRELLVQGAAAKTDTGILIRLTKAHFGNTVDGRLAAEAITAVQNES